MNRVHEFRIRLGLSVWELAQRSKVSPRLVFTIDKNPHYDCKRSTIESIANGMGVHPTILFFSHFGGCLVPDKFISMPKSGSALLIVVPGAPVPSARPSQARTQKSTAKR